MGIKREDLLEAAALGVVQYKQVDPLLVFLLQRDVHRQREAMLKDQSPRPGNGRQTVLTLLLLLVIGIATALVALDAKLAIHTFDTQGLIWFIGLYTFFTAAVTAWIGRRRIASWMRLVITSTIALLPLAVFASQHLRI